MIRALYRTVRIAVCVLVALVWTGARAAVAADPPDGHAQPGTRPENAELPAEAPAVIDARDDDDDDDEARAPAAEDDADETAGVTVARPSEVAHPPAFPDVRLIQGSEPRYGALYADPWYNQVLYVVYDGKADSDGYSRIYVWIPGHEHYDEPRALLIGQDGWFPDVRIERAEGDEMAAVTYRFRYVGRRRESSGAARPARTRTREVFDYATGRTRTITERIPARPERPPRIWYEPNFAYMTVYQRDSLPFGGNNRLHIDRISTSVNVVESFERLGRPAIPWFRPHFEIMEIERVQTGNPRHGVIRPTVRVRHGRIVSMPPGFIRVLLTVNPYLHPPVLNQTYDAADLLREEGLSIDLPFGWYGIAWRIEHHPWIGGRVLTDNREHHELIALGRPVPVAVEGVGEETLSGERAASRLRGPPPPQLRGPGN